MKKKMKEGSLSKEAIHWWHALALSLGVLVLKTDSGL